MPLLLIGLVVGGAGGFFLSKGAEEIGNLGKVVVIGGAVFVAGKALKVF